MTKMLPASASSIADDAGTDPGRNSVLELLDGPAASRVVAPVASNGRRLNILLLTDTSLSAAGGSERFLRNLLSRLPDSRYRVTVVQLIELNESDTDQRRDPMLAHDRLHVIPIGAVYGRRGLLALRTIRQLMRHEHFDIVQSQHEKSDLINALLPRRPGTVHVSNRRDMGFNKSPRLRRLFRLLRRRFHYTLAPSQAILSELEHSERLDARHALCIPNGVDVQRFRPAAAGIAGEYRRKLGLADNCVVFGCVATLTEVKRHVDLLDAFAALQRRAPHTRLLLVGDGPLRMDLEQQIERLGLDEVVHLLGDQDRVERLLPDIDVMVMASSTEGMSNAVLEAMACGLPVIATAVGGNPHLVAHQANGLLVPVHAQAPLVEAMHTLAVSPELRQRMGRAGRARCEREFSLDSMARAFDSTYQRLAQP